MKRLALLFTIGVAAGCLAPWAWTAVNRREPVQTAAQALDENEQTEGGRSVVAAPVQWNDVDSGDLHVLVRNLRAQGFPEGAIYDIARLRLEKMSVRQFAELKHRSIFITDSVQRNKTRRAGEVQVRDRIQETLTGELELRVPPAASALFSSEEEARIQEAVRLYPFVSHDPTNPEAMLAAETNRNAPVRYLAQYLAPEQLTYYKLDREGGAERTDSLLRGLAVTKEKLLAVFTATENLDLLFRNGSFSTEVEDALRASLTDDDYNRLHAIRRDPHLHAVTFFCGSRGLGPQIAEQLVDLEIANRDQPLPNYATQVTNVLREARLVSRYLSDPAIQGSNLINRQGGVVR